MISSRYQSHCLGVLREMVVMVIEWLMGGKGRYEPKRHIHFSPTPLRKNKYLWQTQSTKTVFVPFWEANVSGWMIKRARKRQKKQTCKKPYGHRPTHH